MDTINRDTNVLALFAQTPKEGLAIGRELINKLGGLKLRLGPDMGRFGPLAVNNGIRREVLDTAGTQRSRLVHAAFFISLLTLIATSLFTLFDSMSIVEVAYKVHALAGVKQNFEPLVSYDVENANGSHGDRRAARFISDDSDRNTRPANSEPAGQLSSPITRWVQYPVIANETESLSRQIEDTRCRNSSTYWAQILGLKLHEPAKNVLRLTTGFIHNIRIVSFDSHGRQRCAGGDYYNTYLNSRYWKSRPPVIDLGNGAYEVKLQVDSRFAGFYKFKVVLLFSNFDGLKQLDARLPGHQYKKHLLEKLVGNLDIEFVLPPMPSQGISPNSTHRREQSTASKSVVTAPDPDLKLCRGVDYNLRQWSGRWTRGMFDPNCSIDSQDTGRFKCSPPDMTCEHPWCEGSVGRIDSNGWVYSTHCSFRIFSRDEAWQCLDRKWVFWWSDTVNQENMLLRNLLNSVLGLSLPETRPDSITRILNKVFIRQDESKFIIQNSGRAGQGGTSASKRQEVRVTNMWNANVEAKVPFKSLFSSYFTKTSSPHVVIINSGLQGVTHRYNWTEFVNVAVQARAKSWKEALESSTHARLISIPTAGAKALSEINPQLLEMYSEFVLDAYVKANLTSDFRIVDGLDSMSSWKGRQTHGTVDLMLAHMLLTALCVD